MQPPAQPVAAAPQKSKVTFAQLQKEIEDFEVLVNRAAKILERHLPAGAFEQLMKEQEEHESKISFGTKVECVAAYFNEATERHGEALKKRLELAKARQAEQSNK